MVDGVFTIPFSRDPQGHFPGGDSGPRGSVSPGDVSHVVAGDSHRAHDNFNSIDSCNFVAGPENRLAVFAINTVLERKHATYSPLVIYGPSGTGKSHLVNILVERWKQLHENTDDFNAKAIYITAADFARECSQVKDPLAWGKLRENYQLASLLVLENIEQIASRGFAQQYLIHTLDVIVRQQGTVVITSKAAPSQLIQLTPALRSRLMAGLAIPLAIPGPIARQVILERLAAANNVLLAPQVAKIMADTLAVTVPRLRGALFELQTAAKLDSRLSINVELVKTYFLLPSNKKLSLPKIVASVAKYFSLTVSQLRSPSRQRTIVAARNIAIFLIRKINNTSLKQIGTYFSNRDHTTILYGYGKVETLVKTDPETQQAVANLQEILSTL